MRIPYLVYHIYITITTPSLHSKYSQVLLHIFPFQRYDHFHNFIDIIMHMHIKNIHSPISVCSCIHGFSDNHLNWGNLSEGSSLKKTDSSSLSSRGLLVALHMGPFVLSSIHVGISIGLVQATIMLRVHGHRIPVFYRTYCHATMSWFSGT